MITELAARSFRDKAQLPRSLAELEIQLAASWKFLCDLQELIAFELDARGHPMLAPAILEPEVCLALRPSSVRAQRG